MSIKHKQSVPFLLGIAVIIGMLVGYKIAIKMSPTRNIEQNLVSNILDKISTDYVDQINREKLENLAINEILGKLDPFSSYIPPADLGNINEHMTGSFQGIGLEYVPVGDSPMVVRTIVGGGAENMGKIVFLPLFGNSFV